MSIVTMDMGSYEVDKADSKVSEYEDEVLFAGWIPGLSLQESPTHRTAIPEDLVAASADIFLRKMYSFQR